MSSSLESLKIRAKLLQKSRKKSGEPMQLKDALLSVARSSGYESWKELKDDCEISDLLNPPKWSAQWKTWYNNYPEAKKHLNEAGGYLLPYRKQFFICDGNYISALGIDESDEDLKLVGKDWSHPLDPTAWKRLLKKIRI